MNSSIDKGTAPKAMKFGAYLSRLQQQIWYSNMADGPVWISRWDILDAFHRCNLHPSNLGKFTYIVLPLP